MRYLSLAEALLLHRLVMEQSRQQALLRDLGALESAIAQPRQAFGGKDLYPGLAGKAAALGFSLIQNHPFVDGNKRVGHAAMVSFLRLNGRRMELGSLRLKQAQAAKLLGISPPRVSDPAARSCRALQRRCSLDMLARHAGHERGGRPLEVVSSQVGHVRAIGRSVVGDRKTQGPSARPRIAVLTFEAGIISTPARGPCVVGRAGSRAVVSPPR